MNSESKIKRKKWKEKIEAWQASGKSAASWCRENNVPPSTFCSWKQQLNLVSKKKKVDRSDFVELKENVSSGSGVVLQIKDISVDLHNEFNKETLVRCLKVLKEL